MKVDERGLLSAYNRFSKGPKYKIAIRLLNILKSNLTIDQLNKLNNYDVLTRDERELVKKVIDGYSVLGYNDLEEIIKKYDINYEKIKPIETSKLEIAIHNFLNLRAIHNVHKHLDNVLLSSGSLAEYELNVQEVIRGKYLESVKGKRKIIYDDLADLDSEILNKRNAMYVKTYIEPLDNRITGLYCGNINTIISNSKEVRHAYIINQIYNLVLDGINVCVLSFEFSEKQLLYELLCKHSCSSKFSSNFSIKNKPDKELYKAVYEDFKVYINHLKVYDSDDFLVTNVQSIERELIVTENDFIESTEWGTQVLVVEGINKMKFDDRNRTLIRRNQIEHEYYYMLRDLSQNYLGNPGKIAIIVTNSNLEFHDENLYNNTKFNLSHVSENSNIFSDTIVTLRKSEEYRQNNKIEISVLKSANEICCRNEYQFDNERYEFDIELIEEAKKQKNDKYESYADNIKKEQVL